MNTAILRSRILDLAIRGQLVPQDPNEGTADDLLKTIAAQRGKPITPITDNVPFTIPDNWCWVKLGDIAESNIGLTYKPTEIVSDGIPVYRSNNIKEGKINHTELVCVNSRILDKQFLQNGDILICARNGSKRLVGKSAIVSGLQGQASFGAFMAVCRSNYNSWIYNILNTEYFKRYLDASNSTTINQVTQKMLLELSLPLPPLAEQHRIVAKVEELLSEVDKIEQAQADITQAATILRSRVLDSALKGELTHSNTEEWTWDSITNVTDPISSRDSQIKASKIQSTGKYAVVSQGQKLIDGYCDDEDKVITISPVILFGDHTRNVKYIDFPFVVGADGTKLHKCKSISPKFCYYWMLWAADNMTNRGYERHYSLLKQTPLHLPPLPEQHRIVAKIEQLFTEIDKLVK